MVVAGCREPGWWKPALASHRMGLGAKEQTPLLRVVGLLRYVRRYRGQDIIDNLILSRFFAMLRMTAWVD